MTPQLEKDDNWWLHSKSQRGKWWFRFLPRVLGERNHKHMSFIPAELCRKIYTIRFVSEKSSCPKSTPVNLDLNMHGKSSWRAQGKQVCIHFTHTLTHSNYLLGKYMICNTNAFDMEMFKTVWRPVISAIAYAFISFEDDYIIQRAIAGFRQCATLAGHFHLPDVFDFVVVSLSQATSLLSESLPAEVPVYPIIDIEGQSITVSRLSVEFGTNFRGQLAAVVLFNIVNGNGNALREGWTQVCNSFLFLRIILTLSFKIFEMFQNLFLHSLLPTRMLQMEDFLGGVTIIPLRGSQPLKSHVRNDGGLLSALSSYLMTPYNSDMAVPDATEADVENTLSTIDCITSCRLDELYSQIMYVSTSSTLPTSEYPLVSLKLRLW